MSHTACHTDRGPRENLEDAAIGFTLHRLAALLPIIVSVIADGVGGRQYGAVASAMAIQAISAYLVAGLANLKDSRPIPDVVLDILTGAIDHANRAIVQATRDQPRLHGMSTTVVVAVTVDDMLFVAWCGDSRAYVIDHLGGIELLTNDHSEVQRLIDEGQLTPDEAHHHPLSHTITRYLGGEDSAVPECRIRRLDPGDTILLCTDGLTDVVSDQQIAQIVDVHRQHPADLSAAATALVDEANLLSTTDNTTVVLHTHRPPQPPHQPQPQPASTQLTMTTGYIDAVVNLMNHLQ